MHPYRKLAMTTSATVRITVPMILSPGIRQHPEALGLPSKETKACQKKKCSEHGDGYYEIMRSSGCIAADEREWREDHQRV
jgi:hypothetical protein